MSTRYDAINRLKAGHTTSWLSEQLVRLTELYRICQHPSVLASMRLVLAARDSKQKEEGRSLHG
jgi:hypothetical protein